MRGCLGTDATYFTACVVARTVRTADHLDKGLWYSSLINFILVGLDVINPSCWANGFCLVAIRRFVLLVLSLSGYSKINLDCFDGLDIDQLLEKLSGRHSLSAGKTDIQTQRENVWSLPGSWRFVVVYDADTCEHRRERIACATYYLVPSSRTRG